jgi:hypothetical protein
VVLLDSRHDPRSPESELTLLGIDRDCKPGAQRALLAKSERGQLVYAGPAFIALRAEAREEFETRLAKLKQERPVLSSEIVMHVG